MTRLKAGGAHSQRRVEQEREKGESKDALRTNDQKIPMSEIVPQVGNDMPAMAFGCDVSIQR